MGGHSNPYQIATAADLIQLGESPEDYDKHFILTADINLDPNLPGRKVFDKAVIAPATKETDLWTHRAGFSGVFDGDGHIISNLTIFGINNLGLFCITMEGAEIYDLNLINVDVVGTGEGTQGGHMSGNTGSFVGLNRGSVRNCHSAGRVVSRTYVGGLIGTNYRGSVTGSSNTGYVMGKAVVGGLIGYNFRGDVTNCWGNSTVEGEDWVGGLIGENFGEIFSVGLATVNACYSTGSVTGVGEYGEYYTNVGGLIGANNGQVDNSYSTCSVSGDSTVGGLIGDNGGSVTKCYSTGKVTINLRAAVGGLIGYGYTNDAIASFWDTNSSTLEISAGGEGKTTPEMQMSSTFLDAGWDFVDETENGTKDIWWIIEGQDYPRLWWQYGQDKYLYPENGATDVNQPVTLRWIPGGPLLQHDVYFGKDIQEVVNATIENTNVYRGRQPAYMTTYFPGSLELGQTYFWRIDEIDKENPRNPWKGDVWSFSTSEIPGEYEIVDDFESYNNENNIIHNTWVDSRVNHSDLRGDNIFPASIEQDIVHIGVQSMSFDYNNTGWPNYSETTANISDLLIDEDWTKSGITMLSLWLHGDEANSTEYMYVDLNGHSVVYHDDPTIIQMSEWSEWIIDLNWFAIQGIDLTNVNTISIGIVDKNNPQNGGSGKIYIDDIRLYRPPIVGPILKLDIGNSHHTEELEEGFIPFTIADSGSEVNGISIEFGGTLDSRRRNLPVGVPYEQIYRDFIFSRPGEITVKLSGLMANTTYEITIYAWDSYSYETRVADWTANGESLCQTRFDGAQNPPVAEDDYAFTGVATSDEKGIIFLESAPGEGTLESSIVFPPFAFLNALVLDETEPTQSVND